MDISAKCLKFSILLVVVCIINVTTSLEDNFSMNFDVPHGHHIRRRVWPTGDDVDSTPTPLDFVDSITDVSEILIPTTTSTSTATPKVPEIEGSTVAMILLYLVGFVSCVLLVVCLVNSSRRNRYITGRLYRGRGEPILSSGRPIVYQPLQLRRNRMNEESLTELEANV